MATKSTGASEGDVDRNRQFGAGIVDDPYPRYHELRDQGPVHRGVQEDHFSVPDTTPYAHLERFAAYDYSTCVHVLRQPQAFSSAGFYDMTLNPFIGPTMIGMDEPQHSRMRALLKEAFSKRSLPWWEDEIVRPTVDGCLETLLPRGRADLYEDVASKVPVMSIARGLGLPSEDRQRFFDWAVQMTTAGLPPEDRIEAATAVAEYVAPMIEERRASPGRDLISVLVSATVSEADRDEAGGDTRPLTNDEINAFVRLLIIAGAGTTYRAYGNLMLQLLTHPDQLEAVRADRSLVDAAIHESLRIEQPLAYIGRVTTEDTSVADVQIPQGCPVHAVVGAANHDPEVFSEPERFDIDRPNADRHLSFGFGIHRCLGVHVATGELRVLLDRTLDLLHDLELDGEVHQTGLGFRMPTGLPVRFRAVSE